jgi:hypothetical protein
VIIILAALLILGGGMLNTALAQTRIVVLPFYVEEGADAKGGGNATLHYRRMMRFINNNLSRHGFEVINPFAHDAGEKELNRVMERAREDSTLASLEVCKKYGVDVAYITWLTVKRRTTDDGYCKTKARLDGEGYDSAGRDLGAGVSKTWNITKRDCDDAIAEVEKEVGDEVGMKLTAWSGRTHAATVTGPGAGAGAAAASGPMEARGEGGVLQRHADALANLLDIRLDQCTDYETSEVFGKVLNTAQGVVEAKRFGSRIVPDNPQASYMIWRVRIDNNTDPFRLQANVMHMIKQILDAGGNLTLKGVPYRYSPAEVDMLMGIRTGDATSRQIQFLIDRERARDKRFEGQHDPYKHREGGFE